MPIKNLFGLKFGRLSVKGYSHSELGRAMWLCDCDCGKQNVIIKGKYLLNGDTKSCGCANIERTSQMGKDNRKYNNITINNDIVSVELSDDKYFTCDIGDLQYCYDSSWFLNNSGYARGNINGKLILFHNYIMYTELNEEVDHIDGNRLNNTRKNLRIVTRADNMKNKGKYKNNTSGVTGVSFNNGTNLWTAYINSGNVRHLLGEYLIFEDAVETRRKAEIKYFGEFNRKR